MLESLKTDLLAAQTLVKKKAKSPAALEVLPSQQALEKCLKSIREKEATPEATSSPNVISAGHHRLRGCLFSHVRTQRSALPRHRRLALAEGAAD